MPGLDVGRFISLAALLGISIFLLSEKDHLSSAGR